MPQRHQFKILCRLVLLSVLGVGFNAPAGAQTLQLSKHADFSTTDGIFSFSDSLHAKVVAPNINYFDLDKNEFELKSASGGSSRKGAFFNNVNGTYETHIPLASLNRAETAWEFRAAIEDAQGARFESRVDITIQNGGGASDTLFITGRIDSLGPNFFRISGTTFFVDNATRITENGQVLPFSALMNNWKVSTQAELRNDNRFWAVAITVLERSSEFEVETKGIIASIQGSVIIVNNIHFVVQNTTEILDRNNNRITLAGLKVGMEVEAKGTRTANGHVLAERIKIDDDVIGGDEIEFTGTITALVVDSTSTLKLYVAVDGTVFEVNNQTAILGFNDEPISFFDLRVGEIVEIKGQTRSNNLPFLAVRIEREDHNGGNDLEFRGIILAIQDSTLLVNQFHVRVVPATIILDNNNNFIPLTALRTGLLVEVRANFAPDSTLLATRIKVEDEGSDEVELKGFIEALTEHSITVSGIAFSVNDSTIVLDNNNNRINFSALRTGMLVQVRGVRLLDGSLWATNIKVEDLGNDEIELRGVIMAIGGDSLQVSGVTFFVTNNTVITDRNGQLISFNQLTVGLVVEVRANRPTGRWVATKIHIEDNIDRVVEIRGRIERLLPSGFLMLGHEVRVTNTTIFLNEQDLPITFADLRLNDFVEVRAQLLTDSILVALRVKREDNPSNEVEFTGSLNVLSFSALIVGNLVVRVDAATVYVDHNNLPLAITDLHLGMVVEVQAQRQNDGSLLAVRVQVQQRLSLNGVVSQVSGNSVSIQGLVQTLTSSSLIFDQQNRPTTAQALRANQRVVLVAQTAQGQNQIVTVRVVFDAPTNVAEQPGVQAPRAFMLSQNYPNPFNPSTVIRFELPQAGRAQLAVYNILGHRVRTLVDGVQAAGEQRVTWDGRDDDGAAVTSGIYFYRLEANGLTQTRKLTLMR